MTEDAPPATENRFAASWLSLREPHDASARSVELADAFCRVVAAAGGEAPRIIDLAAGRGANAAYLRPRLPPESIWVLVDHDDALLEQAASRLSPRVVECRQLDLQGELDTIDFGASDGVTASAFLDLVSSEWLGRFVGQCAAATVPVLLSMTFDGHMIWKPADPFDTAIRNSFDSHQRTDKGFGPALGPAAAASAEATFAANGFTVDARPSPWQLSAADPRMLDELIEGIAEACLSASPSSRAETESWRDRRRRQCRDGLLALEIGHLDILALPPEF